MFMNLVGEEFLSHKLDVAKSPEDWKDIFETLENEGPFAGAVAECPFFVTMPPTLDQRSSWASKRDQALPIETWDKLSAKNFMPLDRQAFVNRVLSDFIEPSGTTATHPLVDLDYGLVLTPGGRWKNMTMDLSHLMRIQAADRYFVKFPSAIFSLGALRVRHLIGLNSPSPWEVPEFEVSTRAELDIILERLNSKLAGRRVEVWFRGQVDDYFIDDSLQSESLCAWRATKDSSLVPSLYRGAWHGADLKPYAEKLLRIQRYASFAQRHLQITPFTTRGDDDLPVEKLPENWGWYSSGFSATSVDQEGRHIATRDYHPAFHGLQQCFFLQHYGLPSNILDITKDLDVALFFAQNEVTRERVVQPVPESHSHSVIYVLLLVPGLDRFLDSSVISDKNVLLRPARQKCGLLCGSSFITRNHYARYIGLKVKLRKTVSYDPTLTPSYIYPPRTEDTFLDALLRFRDSHRELLGDIGPFEPSFG